MSSPLTLTDIGAAVELFPPSSWTSAESTEFPERPYPGKRPTGSWQLCGDGDLHALRRQDRDWLGRFNGEIVWVENRRLILAYGSNANPQKLAHRFRGEEVFALRVAVDGWAAAWCGFRRAAGDVVATLVPAPGRVEPHAILALTDGQFERMDSWEGQPDFYRREPFTGRVWLEDGTPLNEEGSGQAVQVYIGCEGVRSPLLIAGQPLLCAEIPYGTVDAMVSGCRR